MVVPAAASDTPVEYKQWMQAERIMEVPAAVPAAAVPAAAATAAEAIAAATAAKPAGEGGSSPLAATTEWVRDENYKFYVGNRFYNVKKDPKEKNELEWNQMTDKEKEIRQAFIDVLMSYNYLRN